MKKNWKPLALWVGMFAGCLFQGCGAVSVDQDLILRSQLLFFNDVTSFLFENLFRSL